MEESGLDLATEEPTRRSRGPDFMCVGAQKAGTQWLYDQLALHPQFWLPPIKEFHHFDLPGTRLRKAQGILQRATEDLAAFNAYRAQSHKPPLTGRDIDFLQKFIELPDTIDLDRYVALFDAKGDDIAGDITPGYSTVEQPTIAAIVERMPDMKVVFIARNPVDRFWSAFNMRLRRGDLGGRTTVRAIRKFAGRPGVMGRSSPVTAVRNWRDTVPDGQFALYFFDDLVANPEALRSEILTFIGAAPELAPLPADFNRKQDSQKLRMNDEQRAAIVELFAEELKACADHLGGPAKKWAKAYQAE